MLSTTAQKAIAAYGGAARWQNAQYLEAEVSARGWAFRLKGRPFFKHAQLRMALHRPFVQLTPIGRQAGIMAQLEGHDVSLLNEQGQVVKERAKARSAFPLGRQLFYWDDLDMGYFACYAFWNYFSLPVLLMNDAIDWQELAEGHLQARFPEQIPTHSPVQDFFFDVETGLLQQHNYTALVISRLAKAAHVVVEHRDFAGLRLPALRQVTPQGPRGGALHSPLLIHIEVHGVKLVD